MKHDEQLDLVASLVERVAMESDTVPNPSPLPPPETIEVPSEDLRETATTTAVHRVVIVGKLGLGAAAAVGGLLAVGLLVLPGAWGGAHSPLGLMVSWGLAALLGVVSGLLLPLDREIRIEQESLTGHEGVSTILEVELRAGDHPVKTVETRTATPYTRYVSVADDDGPAPARFGPLALGVSLSLVTTVATLSGAEFMVGLGRWAGVVIYLPVAAGALAFAYLTWAKRSYVERDQAVQDARLETNSVEVPVPESLRIDPDRPPRVPAIRIADTSRVELPIAAVESPAGVILIDTSGTLGTVELSVPQDESSERVHATIARLDEEVASVPQILGSEEGKTPLPRIEDGIPFSEPASLRGQEGRLLELLAELSDRLLGLDVDTSSVPLLRRGHPATRCLSKRESADEAAGTEVPPELREVLEGGWYELVGQLSEFRRRWRRNAGVLAGARFHSLTQLLSSALSDVGEAVQYSSFNFYCPVCHEDSLRKLLSRDYSVSADTDTSRIELAANSRCFYVPGTAQWRCQACEAEVQTPIPVHKVLDDVLVPTYERLIAENQPARFELDNRTRDKELEYSNRMEGELDQLVRELTLESGRIERELSLVTAQMTGGRRAIETLEQLMSSYQQQQNAIVQKIAADTQRLVAAIDHDTRRSLAERQQALENMLTSYEQAMDELAVAKKKEDMIRDEYLRTAAEGIQRMEKHTAAIATNTARTAENTGAMRVHTGRMVQQNDRRDALLGRVATAGERTAAGMERSVGLLGDVVRSVNANGEKIERGNAISAAVASKHGVKIHDNAWWRFDKNLKKWGAGFVSGAIGESTIDAEARKERALR